LKDLGYSTHLVGKWHLGANKNQHTPVKRGFDSHFGYWNGFISYRNSTHSTVNKSLKMFIIYKCGNSFLNNYHTGINGW